MTERFILTPQAQQDLTDIAEFIAKESGLAAAERVVRELERNFQLLAEQPEVGHGREDITADPAVRFWAVYSYLVAFVSSDRPLAVVSVIHGARDPAGIRTHLEQAGDASE